MIDSIDNCTVKCKWEEAEKDQWESKISNNLNAISSVDLQPVWSLFKAKEKIIAKCILLTANYNRIIWFKAILHWFIFDCFTGESQNFAKIENYLTCKFSGEFCGTVTKMLWNVEGFWVRNNFDYIIVVLKNLFTRGWNILLCEFASKLFNGCSKTLLILSLNF